MALQLVDKAGGGEVTLISMAPNGEVSGLRTALAMGAAKAVLVSDDALAGSDALSTAKVLAKAIERAGGIDLVLTATESTDGYTGTIPAQVAELLGWPSLTFAKHVEIGDGKVKHPAPDRSRLRRGRGVAARGRERDRRCGRAPLPVVQGDHGGEEQAGRPGDRRPTSASTPARSVGRAPARRSRTSVPRPSARPARRSRTTARRTSASCSSSSSSRSSERRRESQERTMAVSKIWVFAEADAEASSTGATLELLTKARELGRHVEAVYVGADADALGRRSRRARRHQGVRDRPRRRAARRRRRRRARGARRRAHARRDPVRAELRRPRRASPACR